MSKPATAKIQGTPGTPDFEFRKALLALLEHHMVDLDLSQTELGVLLGMSPNIISMIKRDTLLSIPRLESIFQALSVPLVDQWDLMRLRFQCREKSVSHPSSYNLLLRLAMKAQASGVFLNPENPLGLTHA